MTFENALGRLKSGQAMTRASWGLVGDGGIVTVQHLVTNTLVMRNEVGQSFPWTPCDADIFAGDWEVVPASLH